MRLARTTAATVIGHKRKKFPFDDQTPFKTPGVPEVREYFARRVLGDDEAGQPSDIDTVTFGVSSGSDSPNQFIDFRILNPPIRMKTPFARLLAGLCSLAPSGLPSTASALEMLLNDDTYTGQ